MELKLLKTARGFCIVAIENKDFNVLIFGTLLNDDECYAHDMILLNKWLFFDSVIRSHNSSSAKDQIGTAIEQEKLNDKALYLINNILFTIKTIKVG